MDFGSILDEWEKQSAAAEKAGFVDKNSGRDLERLPGTNIPGERRSRLMRKKPDASIDLHGLTRDDAWAALESFFRESIRNGNEKVLIIHGKGNHRSGVSGNDAILKETVREFIEGCSLAGESGFNSARDGGTGATWVILKERG